MPPPPPPTLSGEAPTLLQTSVPAATHTSPYLNRDISWLDFNQRVLHEAMDIRTPLLDRLKFLAIYSSNSDEFFMKRVGLLHRKIAQKSVEKSQDGLTAEQVFALVRERIKCRTENVIDLWSNILKPALEAEGIFLHDYSELPADLQKKADDYFRDHIFPILTPLAVDPGHPFPFISNQSLSVGALVAAPIPVDPVTGLASPQVKEAEHLFARIKVPALLSRWLNFQQQIDGRDTYIFTPVESLIEANLGSLFPGMQIVEHQHFRVTRNAEVETDIDDPEDLLEVVQEELRARRFGDTVRVQITASMSPEMRHYLMDGLDVTDEEIYELPEPLGKADLLSIATSVRRPDLLLPPWKPDVAPALAEPDADIFAIIRQGDVLVHHPYESFDSSVERFILSAVRDPKVVAIKMTLYRTSGDSPFVAALARAAEAGKQVVVLVELKARFDEERNIQWAQTLEEAGAHVIYGVLGLKTHTKTALVVRREEDRHTALSPGAPAGHLRCYAHIATGNYNSKTAQVYTDLGLFTCREDICNDVIDLFAFLTGRSLKRDYRKLLVAPVTMRPRFMAMIEREIEHAKAGRPARIQAKMNALEDTEIINALYKASQAGVQIDLIIRGICCLRPGVAGLSENIRVVSVVGRFLEHSRLFYFQNDGKEEYFMGSADWMNRNLSHRVEAAVPIEDPLLQARLREVFDLLLADNRQAWDLHSDGTWTQRTPAPGEPERSAQRQLIERTTLRTTTAHALRLKQVGLPGDGSVASGTHSPSSEL